MDTNINKRFRTRKDQQIANKLKTNLKANTINVNAMKELCEPCRQKAVKQVMDAGKLTIGLFCKTCQEKYINKMKQVAEAMGGELYDGDKLL